MSTLYIDHKHARLSLEGQALVVYFGTERQRPIPLKVLERVVCLSTTQLDTHLLGNLAAQGIAFSVSPNRRLQRQTQFLGRNHNAAELRVLQYRLSLDKAWRLTFTQQLLQAKFRAQLQFIDSALQQRPDRQRVLRQARTQVLQQQGQLLQTENLPQCLGVEGAAARANFQALAALLPDSLGFAGRKRRPPPDPVNASLSLAYTLLHQRAAQQLHAQGLDPLLGFYHSTAFGRESLAADLIEPWRPYIDLWLWENFRTQNLRAHHFQQGEGECRLSKAGRGIFFASLEQRLRPLQRALRRQTRHLMKEMQAWQ